PWACSPARRASLPALSTATLRRRRPLSGSKKYASAAPIAPARANSGISSLLASRTGPRRGYPEAGKPNSLPSAAKVQARSAENPQDFSRLIAPVEVARASPETVVCFHGRRLLCVVFAGPLRSEERRVGVR